MNTPQMQSRGQSAVEKSYEIQQQIQMIRSATERLLKMQSVIRERFRSVLRQEPAVPANDSPKESGCSTELGEELRVLGRQLHSVADEMENVDRLCELPNR